MSPRTSTGVRTPGIAPPERVAVVGGGVAGLTAAHVLAKRCEVTLYEADTRLGGHADTHVVEDGDHRWTIDTGFIVHNVRTYPTLLRLFDELGVATQDSDMSMSVRCDQTGLEYAGALGLAGLFPSWRNAVRPSYLRMLAEIPRFHRMARRLLQQPEEQGDQTLRAFLARGRFSPTFRTHFMESLVACVWSCDAGVALDYPARYLFTFLEHHGMLRVFGSPQWRTVTGGSGEYVAEVAGHLHQSGADVRTGTKVVSVLETPEGVEVTDGNGVVDRFDAAVIAAHPGQALALLAEPTSAQREVLGAIPYSRNTAQLHTDTGVLPRARRARASWNYLRRASTSSTTGGGSTTAPPDGVTVSYDMTRLQRLEVPADGRRFVVTLGAPGLVDQAKVLETMEYEHPIYTPDSVAAQRRLPECDTARIAFAGAWHGWGFHEDGARSGVSAAARLGIDWDGPAPLRLEPTVFATRVRHTRRRPFRRAFEHRSHTWVVDLDHLPRRRRLTGWAQGTFEARDHLGYPERTLKDNVERFLSLHGVEPDGGRIVMAAQPRAFGYCFNPISVFWCHRRDGSLAGVVVEVHNTYGDRHAYLVHPDSQGRARTAKQMYVSPFHGIDGHYELAVPRPTDRLRVSVALHTDDGAVFSASLDGTPVQTSAVRTAPAALRGSVLIRAHGIWLWARRLGVRPRPAHTPQEGVQR